MGIGTLNVRDAEMGDLKPGESSDYYRMFRENRDLRVRVAEQAVELKELREFRHAFAEIMVGLEKRWNEGLRDG